MPMLRARCPCAVHLLRRHHSQHRSQKLEICTLQVLKVPWCSRMHLTHRMRCTSGLHTMPRHLHTQHAAFHGTRGHAALEPGNGFIQRFLHRVEAQAMAKAAAVAVAKVGN